MNWQGPNPYSVLLLKSSYRHVVKYMYELARTKPIFCTAVEKFISACSQVYVHIHQYMVLSCIMLSFVLVQNPYIPCLIYLFLVFSYFCVLS